MERKCTHYESTIELGRVYELAKIYEHIPSSQNISDDLWALSKVTTRKGGKG